MKKKFISLLTAMSMTLMLFGMPIDVSAAGETSNCTGSHTGMTAWNDTASLPTSGSYYLTKDVTLSALTTLDGNLSLCLNGHTVTQSAAKTGIIKVGDSNTFTLLDCQSGKLTGVTSDADAGITVSPVYIDGGTFNMYGSSIDGNETKLGGGVYLKSGTFNMHGGSVSNNTVKDYGKNSYSQGGGVYINDGTFNMTGGTISNNTATRTTASSFSSSGCGRGGGIYMKNGTFELSGGTIKDNTGEQCGGGIYLDRGTVNMTGGTVTGNRTEYKTGSGGGNGGGLYMAYGSFFNLSNGTISNNRAIDGMGGGIYENGGTCTITGGTISGNEANNGGGIDVCGSLTMSSGSITGNKAKYGGGIYHEGSEGENVIVFNGDVNISGNKHITTGTDDNIHISNYNYKKRIITIADGFDTASPIGVHVSYPPTDCTVSAPVTNQVGEEVYAKFKSEQSSGDGCTLEYTDGVIQFEKPHSYSTTYSKDETNHWYECSVCQAKKDEAAHTWNSGTVTKQPTCTAEGEKKLTCTVCSQTKTETVGAKGHSFGTAWQSDGTNHWHKCANCTEINEKAAHTWDDGEITKAATCTEKGVRTYTCTACKKTKTEEINAKGHTEVEIPAVEPTCTETGKTAGTKCSVCNTVLTAQTTVTVLGHDFSEWTVDTPATCTTAGLEKRSCQRTGCTETETRTIPAKGHSYVDGICSVCGTIDDNHTHTGGTATCREQAVCDICGEPYGGLLEHTPVEIPAVEPTCMNTGKTAGTKCSVCDTVLTAQTNVTALGHDFGGWTVDTLATCTATGLEKRFCQRTGCTETETRTIPARGHNYVDEICTVCGAIDIDHLHRGGTATCASQAYCEICGEPYGELLEHTPEEVAAVEPTCTNTGLTAGVKCSVCNAVILQQEVIPTIEHISGDWIVEIPATTASEGVRVKKCTVCGTELEREAIEKLPNVGNTGDVVEDVQDTAGTNAGLVQDNTLIENALTPEDKADIENGSSFKISLEVTDIRDSVPAADVTAASSALRSNEEIGMYVDLSLFKIKDNVEKTPIHNSSGQIGITLTIPESVYTSDRIYSIIRVHDGEAENLGGTYDKASRTLTFYTDKFSTYAIAYSASSSGTDKPNVPDKPTNPSVPSNPTYPTAPVMPVTPTVTETTVKKEDEIISDEPYIEDVSSAAGITADSKAIDFDNRDSCIFYGIAIVVFAFAGVVCFKKLKQK